jgi:AraC-like DNA-binding protein
VPDTGHRSPVASRALVHARTARALLPSVAMLGAAASNRFGQRRLGRLVRAWTYDYERECSPVHRFARCVEMSVVVAGVRGCVRDGGVEERYEPGSICVQSPGEHYEAAYRPSADGGLEVGFVLYSDADRDLGDLTVSFRRNVRIVDRGLVELCTEYSRWRSSSSQLPKDEIEDHVRRFVLRHAELGPLDPLERARREIERTFLAPLYIRHYAEVAGSTPTAFTRAFSRRFGVPPLRYRNELRLREAATKLAARTGSTIAEIGTRVGFADPSYFSRAFASYFGVPPAAYAARFASV